MNRFGQLSLLTCVTFAAAMAQAELAPLRTAAALSPRPAACAARNVSGREVWQAVANSGPPLNARACAYLALVSGLLQKEPRSAQVLVKNTSDEERRSLLQALDDQRLLPLRLRIDARLTLTAGDPGGALEQFRAAAEAEPVVGWEPAAIHDYAVSAARTGSFSLAVELYRRLVVVRSWLSKRERQAVAIEAAVAVLRSPQPNLVEALGYLHAASDSSRSDSALASLVATLEDVIARLGEGTSGSAPVDVRTLSPEVVGQLARLTELDLRFLSAWTAWLDTRDPDVFVGVTRESLPQPYLESMRRVASEN